MFRHTIETKNDFVLSLFRLIFRKGIHIVKPEISKLIKQELEPHQDIDLAILFGSSALGKTTPMSDCDIAVHLNKDWELTEHGYVIAMLEKRIKKKVDLVILNDLPQKKPELAYNVISKGILIFCRHHDLYTELKTKTFLNYLDTAPLREMVRNNFATRIRAGRFGDRNYVEST